MAAKVTLGFMGAGKMAAALAKGFVRAELAAPGQIIASDPSAAACSQFTADTGAATVSSNREVLETTKVVILSVKPNQASAVLGEIAHHVTPEHLLISIAAGVTLAALQADLPSGTRVIRVMPNTPALVGASASAFAAGEHATKADCELALNLFSAVGLAMQVPETLLDAVTGLSGSGPAFVYLFIEALSDGGVAAGLPRDMALRLAAQTVLGGARMVLETGLHPGALKDMVTSPGGTTIRGVHALEEGKMRGTIMSAVLAAARRSQELGQSKHK